MAITSDFDFDNVGSQDNQSGNSDDVSQGAVVNDPAGSSFTLPDYTSDLAGISETLLGISDVLTAPAPQLDSGFNSVVLSWADRCSIKVPFYDHYLFYKSGDYTYTFLSGGFSFDADTSTFTGPVESSIVFEVPHNGHNYYSYYSSTIFNVDLTAAQTIVYSDLGPFPTLTGLDSMSMSLLLAFIIFFCCWTIRYFFSWLLRPASITGGDDRAQTVVVD